MLAEHTAQRHQFGKPIAEFQAVAQRAADAYIDTEMVRLTAWQAIFRLDVGWPASDEVHVAKFWAGDGAMRVVHAAQHLHGGLGVDLDYPCIATSCGRSSSSTASARPPVSCCVSVPRSRTNRCERGRETDVEHDPTEAARGRADRRGRDPMQYQLADLFESVVDKVPDREALVVDEERMTFRELDERSNQLAHHLLDAGIRRGDHVGCYLMNCTEYVETMIACFKIGAVPANVNYRYVEAELRYLFDNADLKAVVFDTEFSERLAKVTPDIDTLEVLIAVDSGAGTADTLPEGAVRFDDVTAGQPTTRDGLTEGRSPDDRYMLYTGGTTGMPKGVVWRHEDIFFAGMGGGNPVAEPVTSPEELPERINTDNPGIKLMAAAPLMHGAAFLGTFIGFFGGNTVVTMRKFSGRRAMELLEREKCLTISLVGDAMALPLIEAMDEREYDVSGWYILSTAGAIMSQSVRDR
jgi:non-ribosomal peptide synthetase component E (peptide arylation enzyme)